MKAAKKGFRFIQGENVNRGNFLYYVTQNVQEPFGLEKSLSCSLEHHSFVISKTAKHAKPCCVTCYTKITF